MKRKPVVALEEVSEDLQLAYDYFAERSSAGGNRFLARFFKLTGFIELNPKLFPVKFDDYRRALIPRSNHAIYFFEAEARSVIVAVIDARRHPRLIRDLIRGRR